MWVSHDDANTKFSGGYGTNCKVRYFKYFPNAKCSAEDTLKLSDCSADGCKRLAGAGSCDSAPVVTGESPLKYTFNAS